jgi:hypothetical protein
LLTRQRSLALPAFFVLLAVEPALGKAFRGSRSAAQSEDAARVARPSAFRGE